MPRPGCGSLLRWVLPLALSSGVCAAEWSVTPSDNATVGPDHYRSNRAEVILAPTEAVSFGLNLGNDKTTTPTAVTTRQVGGRLRWKASPSLAFSLHVQSYADKQATGPVGGTGAGGGDGDTTSASLIWGPTVSLEAWHPDPEAETPTAAWIDVGVDVGRTVVPRAGSEAPPMPQGMMTPGSSGPPSDEVSRDTDPHVEIELQHGPLDLTLFQSRHYYDDNAADPAAASGGGPLNEMHRSLGDGSQQGFAPSVLGQPKSDSEVGLTRRFEGWGRVVASYDYEDRLAAGGIARTASVSAGWEATRWMTVRLGTFWLNQFHRTHEYLSAGVSFSL